MALDSITSETYYDDAPVGDEYEPYRAVSTLAVASLVCGLLSVVAILDYSLSIVPLVGIFLGWLALVSIHKRPDELTGAPLAVAGIALSTVLMLGGNGWLLYVYFNEVPDGYERISYGELQPGEGMPEGSIPETAKALDGKKVFLKGYMYPGAKTAGINSFMLVRDQGDCCFGGNPKITDRVLVTTSDPAGVGYHTGLYKVAGTFHVRVGKASDQFAIFYHLDNAQVQ